jgi:alpha-mannosidase
MSYLESLDTALRSIEESKGNASVPIDRIRAEIDFATKFVELHPEKKAEWQPLILRAAEIISDGLAKSGLSGAETLAAQAEEVMSPIGKAAKEYTVHCCGHAHIDMNWLWPWQDTVSVTHDTFSTVDRLMEEFPEFRFSQSQASTYLAMEDYCPEVFEKVAKRVREGRWESTASMWVEGDKNLASGEILCRNILYTRRYMRDKFGLPFDAVKIDWECDTFGHPYTLPAILNRGGVTRYYRHRTRPEHWLIWWKSPDGSKVLAYYDKATYNGSLNLDMVDHLIDYVADTKFKDYLFIYGVGDHGGGPTRKDLMRASD